MGAHQPVLLAEALELLAVKPGELYVDGTVGLGGHAEEILRRCAPDGRLLGTDRDGETLAAARERLAPFGDRARLEQHDFRDVPTLLGAERPDGILFDLGVSSMQLDQPSGASAFDAEGPLDMRLDPGGGEPAADAGEPAPRAGAGRPDLHLRRGAGLPAHRPGDRPPPEVAPFRTTTDLAAHRRRASRVPGPAPVHPATRTFQALRIAVNDELRRLEEALPAGRACPRPGGRLVVDRLPLPRGPHRQAGLPRPGRRRLRAFDPEAAAADRGRDLAEPPRAQRPAARALAESGMRRDEHFAFAFKPIDNSRVVREVDPRANRDLWLLLALVAALVGGILLYAWPHLQLRRTGIAAEQASRERDRLVEENRKLRLEKAALENLRRVEAIATRDLGLAVPPADRRWWSRRSPRWATTPASPRPRTLAGPGPGRSELSMSGAHTSTPQAPAHRERMIHLRLMLLALGVSLWALIIAVRLFHLQVLERSFFERQSARQSERTINLDPRRGPILDRNRRPLAVSVDAESIYAVPQDIDDPARTSTALSRTLGQPANERKDLLAQLQKNRAFVWVKRKVDPGTARAVRELQLDGIGFLGETRRTTPSAS